VPRYWVHCAAGDTYPQIRHDLLDLGGERLHRSLERPAQAGLLRLVPASGEQPRVARQLHGAAVEHVLGRLVSQQLLAPQFVVVDVQRAPVKREQ